MLAHQDHPIEVTLGKFPEVPTRVDVTRLEINYMSFLQIKSSMGLYEKIRQVNHVICQSRRETAHVWLEAIAGADNPYRLLQVLGWGHRNRDRTSNDRTLKDRTSKA
jgi:hypothetical protein